MYKGRHQTPSIHPSIHPPVPTVPRACYLYVCTANPTPKQSNANVISIYTPPSHPNALPNHILTLHSRSAPYAAPNTSEWIFPACTPIFSSCARCAFINGTGPQR